MRICIRTACKADNMDSIGARIKAKRQERKLSQRELAVKAGWGENQTRISSYESDRTEPSYSDIVKISRVLGVSASWLAFGDAEGAPSESNSTASDAKFIETEFEPWDSDTPLEKDEVALPFFTEVEAAAGNGSAVHNENVGPRLRFALSTLKKAGVDPKAAVCIKVSGNSMEPVIPDGAVIGVDTSNTSIKDGDLYAIKHGDMLRVKVVYRLPTGYRLKSFNDIEWPLEQIEGSAASDIKIVGRVFWYSVLR